MPQQESVSPSSQSVVFHAEGVTKIYQMGEVQVHALRGIDPDLYAGELVVLLGPSGSGKSTLLNILGGLDTPTERHVFYGERDLTRASESELTEYRRYHVGFVFQFYNLIPSLTARENVAVVTEIARTPMQPEEALRLVDLGDRMDHFPAQLSGGEQQRVNQELGTTTAVITHNADIAQMADRVIHLADGRISQAYVNETKISPSELSW